MENEENFPFDVNYRGTDWTVSQDSDGTIYVVSADNTRRFRFADFDDCLARFAPLQREEEK